MMDEKEIRKTLLAYAESGMKKNTAARKLFVSGTGMDYRLGQIKRQTGKNPKNFFDLAELLGLIDSSHLTTVYGGAVSAVASVSKGQPSIKQKE